MNVVIYDDSARDFLQFSWALGAQLFAAKRAVDLVLAVTSWEPVYDLEIGKVDTIQVWGHGVIGAPLIAGKGPNHAKLVDTLKRSLAGERSHVWFRSCNVAAGVDGRKWCGRLATEIGARVAAHTYVIHALQSGLRVALPDEPPSWSTREGLNVDGSMARSHFRAPRTISCLTTDVPKGLTQ